jgi:hypothetical protein
MIVDWTCAECGHKGTAVACSGDKPEHRVALSHEHSQRGGGTRPRGSCSGRSVTMHYRSTQPDQDHAETWADVARRQAVHETGHREGR